MSTHLIRVLATAAALLTGASAQTKLLRFPDIQGNKVVFTYGGDLWTASSSGGAAVRLTAHPGIEVFGKFSPDGKSVAFTGQYDGDEQVYVVPATGGEPKQLTFYPARGPLPPRWGYDNQVYGWSNDGKKVIFRSMRDGWFPGGSRLYTVSVDGGAAEPLPMAQSGAGAFSPGGNKIVYSPQSRDFRTEKRYSGGTANQLFIFDAETHDAKRITTGERASRDPMWIGNAIYFNSDRDGHFNLYSYDVSGGKTSQVTFNKTYDVRWPSSDRESRIVYELNGELQLFDIKSRKSTPISINVANDAVNRRPSRVSAANLIEDFELSPKGERALIAARGDIFTAPVEKGPTRNITRSSNAHDKGSRWSPDGSRISFISDRSGEEEIWIAPQDGSKPAEQITRDGKAFRFAPEWSPDGKKLAFGDKDGRVFVVTLADKSVTEIVHSTRGLIADYVWAPRGEYLAFTMNQPNGVQAVNIYSGVDKQVRRVTPENFNSRSPAWDPEGNYLYFVATHEFAPLISTVEFNFATNRSNLIYALALRKDVKPPFPPESDEVAITTEKPAEPKADKPIDPKADKLGDGKTEPAPSKPDKPTDSKTPKPLTIEFDGIISRVARVPVEAGNYFGLTAKTGHLMYFSGAPLYYGRPAETKTSVRIFAFKDRKETMLLEDVSGYALSHDGSKMIVRQGAGMFVMDATPSGAAAKKAVSTAGLMVDKVPAEEWSQIFEEVWRRYRDFFYVPNMHGYDWEALRKQYREWLPYVAHRSDLNYVISEMISELTVQHAYIDGGDFQNPPRPRVALAGARFTLDKEVGRYKIAKIFEGQNEEDAYRSPLTEIGVDARAGDYVLAVNGVELKGTDDPYRLFRNAADNPVELTLNTKPTTEGSRKTSFRPITDETKLVYLDWVNANRRRVDELSGGRVAYMHIPDMGADGIREFIKWFYPQLRKDGMIIDVRANGGGNVSRMLIERLSQKQLSAQFGRTSEDPAIYPGGFMGPMVTLLNENSASDGDIFPAMFREAGLGPLIGKRSWGGVVGITNRGNLIDGGQVNVPEFALANLKGEWIIEGHGVDPDIEVDNDPRSIIQGKDAQLERGVIELMAKLKANPIKRPVRPPPPVKLK